MKANEVDPVGLASSSSEERPLLPGGASTIEEPAANDLIPRLPHRLRELVPVTISISGGIAVLVGTNSLEGAGREELGPEFWPTVTGWTIVALGGVLAFTNVLRAKRFTDIPDQMTRWGIGRIGATAVILIGYLMLWNVLQFWLITLLATALLTVVYGARNWKTMLLLPVIMTLVLHFLFIVALRVPL